MLGIGVDIVSVHRMKETLEQGGSFFLDKVFTPAEKEYCHSHPDAAICYAGRFAAKEAIFKTFATEWKEEMSFLDIEIHNGSCGEPLVLLHGRFPELLAEKGGHEVIISLSWEQDTAVAFAVMV